jgi:pyruvate dehydrogenase (quinone)
VGDVRTTIEALLPLLQQNWDAPHLAQAREHYTRARKALDELAVGTNPRSP